MYINDPLQHVAGGQLEDVSEKNIFFEFQMYAHKFSSWVQMYINDPLGRTTRIFFRAEYMVRIFDFSRDAARLLVFEQSMPRASGTTTKKRQLGQILISSKYAPIGSLLPLLSMICQRSRVYLQVATVKMRKMFCTCEKFSVFQKLRKSAHNQWKMQFLNAFLLKKKRVFHWAKTSKMHSKMRKFPQF